MISFPINRVQLLTMSSNMIEKSIVTVKNMLTARGCTFDEEESLDDDVAVCMLTYERADETRGCVYWPVCNNLGVSEIAYFTKLSMTEKYKSFIIVAHSATSQARKSIVNDLYHVHSLEFFTLSSLQVDITTHKLVPNYTRLTPEESKSVQKKYNTTLDKFPGLIHTNPISRYYDFRPGDLIKVESYYCFQMHKPSLTTPNIMYRHVI